MELKAAMSEAKKRSQELSSDNIHQFTKFPGESEPKIPTHFDFPKKIQHSPPL